MQSGCRWRFSSGPFDYHGAKSMHEQRNLWRSFLAVLDLQIAGAEGGGEFGLAFSSVPNTETFKAAEERLQRGIVKYGCKRA